MRPVRNFLFLPLAMVCLLLAACASAPEGHKDVLDFLNDGVTRREDVLLKLGAPTAQYEDSRILAYRLGKDGGVTSSRPDAWIGTTFNTA